MLLTRNSYIKTAAEIRAGVLSKLTSTWAMFHGSQSIPDVSEFTGTFTFPPSHPTKTPRSNKKTVFVTSCLAALGTNIAIEHPHEKQKVKTNEWRHDLEWPSIFGMLSDQCLKHSVPSSCLTMFGWTRTSFSSITCSQATAAWRCAVTQG